MALTNTLSRNAKAVKKIKKGIWLYILLLIFEGSLRKWLLPGLSNALLVVRDPVAIWLMISAANAGINYTNGYIKIITSVTFFSVITTLIWGHGNLIVALFGARIMLLHFPLIFLISKVFTKEDVLAVGKFIVYLTIPMTVLIAVQFYSPQSAFVNRGIGGNLEGAGFSANGDYFRPPGTFSFTAGNSLYYAFAAPFIFFFLFYSTSIKKYIVYISVVALLLGIPFSISRTILFSVVFSVFFLIISFGKDAKKTGQIVGGVIGLAVSFFILSKLDILSTSFGAFTERFTSANESEGGLEGVFGDRILGGLISGIRLSLESSTPFFGLGIGMGTNVGAQLLVGDNSIFLVAEVEWGRIMGESGLIIGLLIILIRVNIVIDIFMQAYKKLQKKDALPWLMLSFSAILISQGQLAAPTGLGFFVMGGGLTLASLNES